MTNQLDPRTLPQTANGPTLDAVTEAGATRTADDASPAGIAAAALPAAVGPYRIVGRLGEGGMGAVYRAEQTHPIRRTVAVKVIRAEVASEQVIARFEAERQALARMDHPNVAKVLDAGADRGRPYFVMELAPGVPITRFCDENRLPLRDRLELFCQVCEAIAHAHTKAILHRDIKSSNVLAYYADGKPTAKVIDFGIAKAMTPDAQLSDGLELTQVGRPIGTYEAMSPEQADGSPDVDTRTDVYALGVLLYELVCGHKPFASLMSRGMSDFDLQRVIRQVDPPRPSQRVSAAADDSVTPEIAAARRTTPPELARRLRSELEWIPLKAMRKDRDRRYAGPAELAEDVRNYLAGRPLLAGPESRAYRARKFVGRNRGGVAAAAAAVAVAVVGTTLYVHNIRAEQRRTAAEQRRTVAALADVTEQKAEADRQRVEARRETATADAVVDFQTDMLEQADPERAKGDRVTVVEAMAAAIKKLDDGGLADQPLAEMRVRRTAAETLSTLGRYADAERQARRAVDLARRHLPAGDDRVAVATCTLANILRDAGRLTDAEPLFRQALAIARRALPPGDRQLAAYANNLAMALEYQGKLAEAKPLFREAVAVYRRASTTRPADPDVTRNLVATLVNLGGTLNDQGKPAEAEPVLREALAVAARGGLPPDHPYVANGSGILAYALGKLGRPAEAESFAREALRIDRKTLPAGHQATVSAMAELADVLRDRGSLDEAEALYRGAIVAGRRSTAGVAAVVVDQSTFKLAQLLLDQGRAADAEPFCRQSLAFALGTFPDGAGHVAEAADTLSHALHAQGKDAEAEAVLVDALDRCRHALPANDPVVVDALVSLGGFRLAVGRAAAAEAGLRQASALLGPADKVDPMRAARLASTLGRAILAQGRPAEAVPSLRQATDGMTRLAGPNHPMTVSRAAGPLADALDQLGRHDEAAAVRREHAVATATTRPATGPTTAATTRPTP